MGRSVPWLCITLLALALASASREPGVAPAPAPTGSGPPRAFAMGISSLPPELTQDSYAGTFELAAQAGEVILIQRTLPWNELLAGSISQETAQTTRREVKLADDNGLALFVAIDPTDPSLGRSELAGLPPELRGAGFADQRITRAFVAYAAYVAQNYRPAYLGLGVEINTYERHQPEDFGSFVSAYNEAYASVKQLSPDTLVFPIFQFEELQGLLALEGGEALPQWDLIRLFDGKMDLLAVSSYPSAVFTAADQMPFTYYTQLAAYTNHRVVIAGMGYASSEEGVSAGGEEEQGKFLTRALDAAQRLSMPLVVWFAGQDLTYTGQPPFDRLQHLGLRRQDGSPKAAWLIWEAAARRPLAERLATP